VTDQGRDAAAITARLREALEETAAALEAADLDRLLRAEAGLELAVRRLSTLPNNLPPATSTALRLEVRSARQALNRCRTLGATLVDVVRLSLEAQGRNPGYGRHQESPVTYGRRAIDTRG
jgi:hypothetical protein